MTGIELVEHVVYMLAFYLNNISITSYFLHHNATYALRFDHFLYSANLIDYYKLL